MDGAVLLAAGLWLAFFGARLVRSRGVPELVGFLVVGAAVGPSGVGLLDEELLGSLEPLVAVATAVLMFGVGERLCARELRAVPHAAPAGALSALGAAALVAPLVHLAGADAPQTLLLAVLAACGAPMTLTALASKSRSRYAQGLVGAHASSDALAATAFAVALPAAVLMVHPGSSLAAAAGSFARLGAGSVALGLVVGAAVCVLGRSASQSGEAMVVVAVHMVVLAVFAHSLGASIPLAALTAGATVATCASGAPQRRMFRSVRRVEEPLFLLFFTVAGASIHLDALASLGVIGAVYVLGRTAGRVVGGALAGRLAGMGGADPWRLGVDMVPQAGSAVALAVIVVEQLPHTGPPVAAVVLGAIVIFEAVGPFLTARNLARHAADSGGGAVGEGIDAGAGAHMVVSDVQPQLIGDTMALSLDVPNAALLEEASRYRAIAAEHRAAGRDDAAELYLELAESAESDLQRDP